MTIQIVPLPADYLRRVREDGLDDLGQPVRRVTAEGGEPCRDVLRRAQPGEELILASFSPHVKPGPYHEYGPIFVLAHPAEIAVPLDALPLYPDKSDSFLRNRFVVRAYTEAESIADAELVTTETAEAHIAEYLTRPDIAFVQARFPTYGCFACRIERGGYK